MALADAVLGIAEAMDKEELNDASETLNKAFSKAMKGFARELRTAVKAAEQSKAIRGVDSLNAGFDLRKEQEESQRRKAAQRLKQTVEQADLDGGQYVRVEGGPCNGDSVPLDNRAPAGCKAELVAQHVYVLGQDRVFRYSIEESQKLAEQRGK